MAGTSRRLGTLSDRLRPLFCEVLGGRAQQPGSQPVRTLARVSVPECTSAGFTAVSQEALGMRALGTKSRTLQSSYVGTEQGTQGIFGSTFTRSIQEASTKHPSEKAAQGDEVRKEGQKLEEEAAAAQKQEEEEEEEVDEKTKTLRAALAYVPKLGWTEDALVAGARDVGLSPAIVGAFPRKEAALVEFFMDECTEAMVEELESQSEELGKLLMQERIAKIVWLRLELQIPYISKWAQALSIQANPMNLPSTLKQRALLIDEIWHTAGDRSADMDWYAKRAVLSGVYSTTELYMLTDSSPGFRDTRAFLERRINDALDCRKTVQEAEHLAQAVGAGLQNTFSSFFNKRPPSSGFGF